MNYNRLKDLIRQRNSFLCVGLDPDVRKFPRKFRQSPEDIFAFNKEIIDATRDLCVAYKLNSAFYEVYGAQGWEIMYQTMEYIGDTHLKIADAKRGDIGNTSQMYARAFFESMNADALTVAPYMGSDSVQPFLEFKDKWTIILGLTSNVGSEDFQFLDTDGKPLYERVLATIAEWGSKENTMVVAGATHPEYFKNIRDILPEHFLLVPGVGAQGGDLAGVYENGKTKDVGLLINSTRAIIYAGGDKEDYIDYVREAALGYQQEMEQLTKNLGQG